VLVGAVPAAEPVTTLGVAAFARLDEQVGGVLRELVRVIGDRARLQPAAVEIAAVARLLRELGRLREVLRRAVPAVGEEVRGAGAARELALVALPLQGGDLRLLPGLELALLRWARAITQTIATAASWQRRTLRIDMRASMVLVAGAANLRATDRRVVAACCGSVEATHAVDRTTRHAQVRDRYPDPAAGSRRCRAA
jgi:hypothetical protein